MSAKIWLINQIDSVLPQTQCSRCGYPICLDYAGALANDEADINQCTPGGEAGIAKLVNLLNKPAEPLNPVNGVIGALQVAVIDEDVCIGCTLCIKACPVDAILGSNKMMHTVIDSECTGCDLCAPVCPVDCISMVDTPFALLSQQRSDIAKERFNHHNYRKVRDKNAREERLARHSRLLHDTLVDADSEKNDILAGIMAKVTKPPK